jgi:hypothetical protein
MKKPFLAVLFCLFATTVFGQEYSANEVPQQNVGMTFAEAMSYQENTIDPLFEKVIGDQTYPSGIRERIALLRDGIRNNSILFYPDPFYSLDNKLALISLEWDTEQNKPVLIAFIPAIKDLRTTDFFRSDENFELSMAIFFAIEYVHIEFDHYRFIERPSGIRPALKTPEEDDAEAWGVAILQMIRPSLQAHRPLPENLRHNSKELKSFKDNYHDPRWVREFAHYADSDKP